MSARAWPPTTAETLRAVGEVFASTFVAAASSFLAVKSGIPYVAPLPPMIVGVAWGRGRLGGRLLPPDRGW